MVSTDVLKIVVVDVLMVVVILAAAAAAACLCPAELHMCPQHLSETHEHTAPPFLPPLPPVAAHVSYTRKFHASSRFLVHTRPRAWRRKHRSP